MKLDPNHLTYLMAIARTGSFSRAAIELGQSQPALSNNIAILERRLGVRLLERSKRGSTLTAHGEILVRRAEGLTSILEDAVAEVRNLDLAISGPLRVGATPSTLPSLLPLALSMMGQKLGASQVELIEDLDHALADQLLSGRVDMIVGPVFEQFTSVGGITEVELLRDPFCIATALDGELGKLKSIAIEDLSQQTWLLPLPGSTYRRHVEAIFINQGQEWPKKAIYANSLSLIEAMVVSGNCVTIVSPLQLRLPHPRVKLFPIKGRSSRKIGYKIRTSSRLSPIGLELKEGLERAALQMLKEFDAIGLVS